jgi:ubiquinol-cytochrome c reductase core subunit 2
LIGGETSVKWSTGSSALAQAAGKVHGASAKSFLLPYSDASLFGVVVTAPTSEGVAAVAKDVAAALKGASKASGEEIKRAIAKAKFADAVSREQQLGLISTAGPAVSPHH